MEKLPKRNRRIKIEFVRLASIASVGFSLLFVANTFAQNPPPPPGAPAPAAEATAERVIVTGSNIPTSEETGPNPVDTYRTEDIQKLGVMNQTDLLNKLPVEAAGKINQKKAHGGGGGAPAHTPPPLSHGNPGFFEWKNGRPASKGAVAATTPIS